MDYPTLTSAVVEAWEGDGDIALATYIPRAIDLAEELLTRRLDSYGMVVYADASTSVGDAYVSVPSGIRVVKSVTFVSAGESNDLFLRTDEYVRKFWPIRSSVGTPKYYAKRGYTSIYMAPTPATAAALEFSGCARPIPLTSATPENWFSQYASRALFYATMVEVSRWGKSPKAEASWKAALDEEIAMMREEDRRTRRDDQEPANAQNGGDNAMRSR
jgi:hypothetical protein